MPMEERTGDPFLLAALDIFDNSLGLVQACITDIEPEVLNWKPTTADTNSLAVLTTHGLASTREWLEVALGQPRSPRVRDEEFVVRAADSSSLLGYVERVASDCRSLLNSDAADPDWGARRQSHDATAAWALMHAIEHLCASTSARCC